MGKGNYLYTQKWCGKDYDYYSGDNNNEYQKKTSSENKYCNEGRCLAIIFIFLLIILIFVTPISCQYEQNKKDKKQYQAIESIGIYRAWNHKGGGISYSLEYYIRYSKNENFNYAFPNILSNIEYTFLNNPNCINLGYYYLPATSISTGDGFSYEYFVNYIKNRTERIERWR